MTENYSAAVIGGTFDPIHNGHLAVGEAVWEKFRPQKVLFVPCGQPPHKLGKIVTPAEHRYNMALIATADNPVFEVSRIELDRSGISFTVDTVTQLKAELEPGAKILFVTGADAMEEVLTWHDAETLLKICRFAAVTRPGTQTGRLEKYIEMLKKKYSAKISLLQMPGLEISGSDLRARMAEGKTVRYLLPRGVEDYARRNNIYSASAFSFDEAAGLLASRLSKSRFAHTMGVVESAEELARRYGADTGKARIAALLHDCAKEYGEDKKRALCRQWGISLDGILGERINLSHSLLGAESATRDFGIYDGEILQSIRYHTTGGKGMTLLDKIIMLADFIEPTRKPYPGLAEIRELALKDINEALKYGILGTIKENEGKNLPIHPQSREALEEL